MIRRKTFRRWRTEDEEQGEPREARGASDPAASGGASEEAGRGEMITVRSNRAWSHWTLAYSEGERCVIDL